MHRLIILSLTVAGLATLLQADAWNKKTQLTVNETIEVPGATLTPGKYVVKLVDSQANRHIVQFTNETEDRVISTVLAIPNQRLRPTGDSEFSFFESSAGTGPVLRAWFYPGDNFGQEFAYPERRAQELSRISGDQVPVASGKIGSTDADAPEQVTEAREPVAPAPAENPRSTTAARTQPAVPQREPADRTDPALLAQAQQPPPSAREGATTPPRPSPMPATDDADELPATASPAPLLGLMGFLSLGAAFGLRRFAKRSLR